MSEEIYKRARLARMFKSPKVGAPATDAPKYVGGKPPEPTWHTLASRNKAVGEKPAVTPRPKPPSADEQAAAIRARDTAKARAGYRARAEFGAPRIDRYSQMRA